MEWHLHRTLNTLSKNHKKSIPSIILKWTKSKTIFFYSCLPQFSSINFQFPHLKTKKYEKYCWCVREQNSTTEIHLWHLKIETCCRTAYEWGNNNSFFGETQILFDAYVKSYWTILALHTFYTEPKTNIRNITNDSHARIAFLTHAYVHSYTYTTRIPRMVTLNVCD